MNTFLMKYKMMKENVKMSSTWGQSAWFKTYKKYVFDHQRLHVVHFIVCLLKILQKMYFINGLLE